MSRTGLGVSEIGFWSLNHWGKLGTASVFDSIDGLSKTIGLVSIKYTLRLAMAMAKNVSFN